MVVIVAAVACFASPSGTPIPARAYAISWTISTIDSVGDVYGWTSLALDSEDCVHISYYDETNANLKYATNADGVWVTSTIDQVGSVVRGGDTSLAVDSHNRIHISYYDSTNGDLKYATNAGGTWTFYRIDRPEVYGSASSLALDSGNNVHISCVEPGASLKYVTNGEYDWEISAVDDPVPGGYPSLAVDSRDMVHISYMDADNKDLKYAVSNEPVIPEFGQDTVFLVVTATLVLFVALARRSELRHGKQQARGWKK